jgi:alanyl-tRNA synthetase
VSVAERLYYASSLLEFPAVITDIRLHSTDERGQLWQVSLDRTAFYPAGGGQPCDVGVLTATAKSGAVLDVAVERVEEDDAGEVWHAIRKPLETGTEVLGVLDAVRRVDHEQQHSGQHLLSAMFLRRLKARTVSFHLSPLRTGSESVTIDLALPEGMERLSAEDLARVEDAANAAIRESRPVISHWIQQGMAQEMLRRGDLVKLPEREGPMRLVQMQGIEFNACGGTHVGNTGAIGAILLRRVEKAKGNWRVEFVCGERAIRAARRDAALLNAAAKLLSVGAADVPVRVEKLLVDVKAAQKELKKLTQGLPPA